MEERFLKSNRKQSSGIAATRRVTAMTLLALLVFFTFTPGAFAADKTRPAGPNPYDSFRNRDRAKGAMNRDQELEFSEAAHQEISKKNRFITDPRVVNYVNRVGRRVAEASDRPDLPYQFYVIANDQINAFTPGGGKVYIYSGLLKKATTEGQLAAVLAHEVGHNVGYHLSATIKRQQTTGVLVGIVGAVLGNGALGNLGQLATVLLANGTMFSRSREQEREADYLGLYQMDRAEYNTGEMIAMFNLLASMGQREPGLIDKVFSSHPPPTERAQNTEREILEHLDGSNQRGIRNTDGFVAMQRALGGIAIPNTPTDNQDPKNPGNRNPDPDDNGQTGGLTYDDAEEILERAGIRGAKPLEGARGDILGGRQMNDTIIVYQIRNEVRALADLSGRPYNLTNAKGSGIFPIAPNDIIDTKIIPVRRNARAQVLVTVRDRNRREFSYVWEWTGRAFRYLGIQQ